MLNEIYTGEVTPKVWMLVLSSALTRWNMRFGNAYSLRHLLGALHKLEDKIKEEGISDSSTPEANARVKELLADGNIFIATFFPVRKVIKMIDRYLESGRKPSLKQVSADKQTSESIKDTLASALNEGKFGQPMYGRGDYEVRVVIGITWSDGKTEYKTWKGRSKASIMKSAKEFYSEKDPKVKLSFGNQMVS